MAAPMIEYLRLPEFNRDLCIALLLKWAPLYFEGQIRERIVEGRVETTSNLVLFNQSVTRACKSASVDDPILFEVMLYDETKFRRAKDHAAVLTSLLWGKQSEWLTKIYDYEYEYACLPTFLCRAIELCVPDKLKLVYTSRRAMLSILDVDHYINNGGMKKVLPPESNQIRLHNGNYKQITVETVSVVCLMIAAWKYTSESGTLADQGSDDAIKTIYMLIRRSLMGESTDMDSVASDVRSYLYDNVSKSTPGQIFHDAQSYIRSLTIRPEDYSTVTIVEAISGIVPMQEFDAQITLSIWRTLLGPTPKGVSVDYEGLRVPAKFAVRVHRYLVPYILSTGEVKPCVPLYPMIARSFWQALMDHDAPGMTLVARSMIAMIVKDHTPVTVSSEHLPAYAMLPAFFGAFADRMWPTINGPYADPGGLDTLRYSASDNDEQVERIKGFGPETANFYTGLLAFLDMESPHMISKKIIKMLMDKFVGSMELQRQYAAPWWVVSYLYEHTFIHGIVTTDMTEDYDYGFWTAIPHTMNGVKQLAVACLYMLVLCPAMSNADRLDLFMGIRLCPPNKFDRTAVQTLPPQRGTLDDLQCYLTAPPPDTSSPPVYTVQKGTTPHMKAFIHGLACIDLMGFFPATDGTAMRRAASTWTDRMSKSGRPAVPATASTYRGEISSFDILPYVDIRLFAKDIHKMERMNGLQGKIMPVYKEFQSIRQNRRCPLYGSHPVLYECVTRYPITEVVPSSD